MTCQRQGCKLMAKKCMRLPKAFPDAKKYQIFSDSCEFTVGASLAGSQTAYFKKPFRHCARPKHENKFPGRNNEKARVHNMRLILHQTHKISTCIMLAALQ